MFCDANMLTQYYLTAWRAMIFNGDGEYFYPGSLYKKNIDIYPFGEVRMSIKPKNFYEVVLSLDTPRRFISFSY